MRLKINLSGILDEVEGDYTVIPYLLKMYLKDIENLPIVIDPNKVAEQDIDVETGKISYQYHLTDELFYVDVDYHPEK